MNGGFYILPNEEGYLVKSYDTNSEIALFRSRRDAEVFINTLMLPTVPSSVNAYPPTPIPIPQYATQQPQQIITPYPTSGGTSPQVFFIQQPAPAQQVTPSPYYPTMPLNPTMMGGCYCVPPGMYPNYYGSQNNHYGPAICSCGHPNGEGPQNNSYRADEQLRQSSMPGNTMGLEVNQGQNNENFNKPSLEQNYDNSMMAPAPTMTADFQQEALNQQENYEPLPNNEPYYEQAFVSNPVFLDQQPEQFEQLQNPSEPINLANNDEFFNSISEKEFSADLFNDNNFSDNYFNDNSNISKKETKRLMKEELKAAKMQAKLEKQNQKKAKRKRVLDIEDLPPIVK